MTHFTVLVAVPEDKSLEDMLAPFDENPNDPEYRDMCLISDSEVEEITADWEKTEKDNLTLEEYMRDSGYQWFPEEQGWGYFSAKNAKWDWWVIGGRWEKAFNAVAGYLHDFDFPFVQEVRVEKALRLYDAFQDTRNEIGVTEEEIQKAKEAIAENKYVSSHWQDAKELALDMKAYRECSDYPLVGYLVGYDDVVDVKNPSREDYENQHRWRGLTHAILTEDGEWVERGQMGWWAMCAEENADTFDGENGTFWTFVKNIDPHKTELFLIDCHI